MYYNEEYKLFTYTINIMEEEIHMYINYIAKHLFDEIAARNQMCEQEVECAIVRQYRADLTSANPLLRES